MIPRHLATQLQRLAPLFPVVTLTGPRQSGKSTLVRAAFPDYQYANLESPETQDFARKDPQSFLKSLGTHAIVDEIQRAPQILSFVQVLVDEPGNPRSYILTGSQNLAIADSVSQTLAGRTAVCVLLPLSQAELQTRPEKPTDLLDWIIHGGYPRIFDKKMTPADFHLSYIQTYVERDVRNVLSIGDLGRFQEFLQLCAGRAGQLLNYSSFASDLGVAVNTVKSWLSVLQATWVVHLLRPHHANYSKRIVKSPKLYFVDTGLACSLLGIRNPATLSTHPLKGALFENAVISEILKHYHNSYLRPPLYFWRDKTGHEVDCIIDDEGTITPMEIKAARTVSGDAFAGLEFYGRLSGSRRGILVYGGDDTVARDPADVISWQHVATYLEKHAG
ncbi:MAG: DUF4143 domain-containing protein [Chitinivibrionales bacterium]|nr:DUF4143 domain-containing protein [Chitinivibrionales bacterium]